MSIRVARVLRGRSVWPVSVFSHPVVRRTQLGRAAVALRVTVVFACQRHAQYRTQRVHATAPMRGVFV